MKSESILKGRFVKLSPLDLERDAMIMEKWYQDSEFLRLMDSELAIPRTMKQIKGWYEKEYSNRYEFIIRIIKTDEPIGFIGFGGIDWASQDAWMGIGIGLRKNWGKGYGTEALLLLLKYGFEQLNLNRVTLSVFSNNPRAIRSYENVGFKTEGRQREVIFRDGQRYDEIYMRIFRDEWLNTENNEAK